MIVLALFALFLTAQASVWDNLTANLAVVEYQPTNGQTSEATVLLNTIHYMEHVMALEIDTELDLIVFPESTLGGDTDSAVEVEIGANCTQCPDPLNELSYLARTYRTYVVVNLLEKSKCEENDQSSENCQKYGFRFYNTDVVFDRKGTIIDRYRKFNLFGESNKDKPETADQVIVRTDFGLNFGIFTCFDILFKNPSQDLLAPDVHGVIFPTMWFSELPFLTAMQTQQMFGERHDVAVLAAGANNPRVGSGGSGIYLGSKGAAISRTLAEGGSQALVYKSINGQAPPFVLPDVDEEAKSMDNFYLKRDANVDSYSSVLLNTSTSYKLCHENLLCCNFNITTSQTTPKPNLNFYTYRLVAYSGVRTFDGVYNGGVEVCGILACKDSTLSSCGHRFDDYDTVQWPVTFEKITVTADFEKTENKTQFPNSLLSSIRPIEASKTVWNQRENGAVVETSFTTDEKQDRLLTFGIFGRNFGADFAPSETGDGNRAGHVAPGIFLVGVTLAVLIMK